MFFTRGSILLKSCIKRIKFSTSSMCKLKDNDITDTFIDDVVSSDIVYNEVADTFFRLGDVHNCLLIQPYVKWGPKKKRISVEEELGEAIALIETLPSWTVEETVSVPLDRLDRNSLFKSGSMKKLQEKVHKNNKITAIFVNVGSLKKVTMNILKGNFSLPILDRYKIVMQIFKVHATSKTAKLQVALAELYYVQRKAEKSSLFVTQDQETLKLMFQNREKKLKNAIKDLRHHRILLRKKRQKIDYPIVAVIGYTNAGKTSIIKALTGEESLQPRNQLFATLDITLHAGILPSGLEVLYVDTVGFISDIPTNLIECFISTLEDAVLADIILHVEDLSSLNFEHKRNHVFNVLKDLAERTGNEDILQKVINIGNKCDLVKNAINVDALPVSAQKEIGLEHLRYYLEDRILKTTSRQKLTIKVTNGGDEIRWLYKNATVVSETPDKIDEQYTNVKVIITNSNLQKFKHYFISD